MPFDLRVWKPVYPPVMGLLWDRYDLSSVETCYDQAKRPRIDSAAGNPSPGLLVPGNLRSSAYEAARGRQWAFA
ncbi:hypothetical protein HOT81_gp077 [Gordonia phage Fryberger]|uniref:Uncharacterized protein n=1 Tax=Gordonia phage Fryberger TaxID=2250392 RepID=A0A346FCN0_9CAUD|nr:hypothetical protein HOT81_gp077 [Gordonia phage Fryberger]AXN53494.1 hypothetical protein SEA_FRYBERGER_77 [Gordonia phage Fryberger]